MKCPSCAGATLVCDTRDLPYVYKGETTTIPAVRGAFCPACGKSVLTAAESKRVSAAMLEFNKKVSSNIVESGFGLLHLSPGGQVGLTIEGDRLVVSPQRRPRYRLDDLLARCDPKAPRPRADREWVSDGPLGGELL
ncbi:MAG: type II toxin-antitoxin system MqsA family antitoxin [Acidobacteria bacterium]|nr:type II toxin-antitoxin system MqsA family antitoxin [Acidobacteriota bacterium]